MKKKKIGVYICHCGGNISDYVDVEKVRQAVEGEDIVFLAKTTMFACSDANQREMVNDIEANGLTSVVVASCSPKLHLLTFRNVSQRANLNKYTYVHANIREQASWAHSDNKIGATEKAIHLVKAAIAKANYAEALESNKVKAQKSVAIIGAGVAGMKAAISLSNKDCEVILIEKEPFVGGRVAQWNSLSTTTETGKEIVKRLYDDLITRDNITICTNSEVISNKGSVGNFTLKIKTTPRYIRQSFHPEDLTRAIEVCPVSVPDEFNFRLTQRKAIYKNYPGEYPQTPVIDIKNCTRCGACEKVCPAVDFNEKEEITEITVGSVLMATGFDPYTPGYGEFGYATSENVITLPQFKRLIDEQSGTLVYKGKVIKNIAYIYCVGSRQTKGDNTYCSRNCCTSTIHAAVTAKSKFPDINNFHFNRGLRTYGKQEILYADSLRSGDIYLQSYEDGLPTVTIEGNKTIVKINDILTNGKEIEVEADLVVLVTGMVPRADNKVGTLFKLPKGRDKFYNEIHMKLRPVETVIDGVTIAGACQGPKNIAESVNSALSAATKSYSIISKGELESEPLVAIIDQDKCTWCGACEKACPFDAILKVEDKGKIVAEINNSVCKGCGMCAPVCEPDAINVTACSSTEIMSMIDTLV
ncbi:MAG: CoB--CoM heterodisulfide reductase iron-sulfur subunit A family protein [Bacteroidales bacterium]|nr:CoB--CoM heterodisulfide reductase iron-sulfur subunit A family protein [Bacteroidales bacterium]